MCIPDSQTCLIILSDWTDDFRADKCWSSTASDSSDRNFILPRWWNDKNWEFSIYGNRMLRIQKKVDQWVTKIPKTIYRSLFVSVFRKYHPKRMRSDFAYLLFKGFKNFLKSRVYVVWYRKSIKEPKSVWNWSIKCQILIVLQFFFRSHENYLLRKKNNSLTQKKMWKNFLRTLKNLGIIFI